MSGFACSASVCGLIFTPPIRHAVLSSWCWPKRSRNAFVCSAISRVGERISPRTPRPCVRRSASGRTNAAVLPEPVCARPMTSRPERATGITSAWMGVGYSKPILRTTSRMAALSPSESNGLSVVETGCCGMATDIDVNSYINGYYSGGQRVLDAARQPGRIHGPDDVVVNESAAVPRPARPPAQQVLVARERAVPSSHLDQCAPQRRRQVQPFQCRAADDQQPAEDDEQDEGEVEEDEGV